MAVAAVLADHSAMSERGLHYIADDLSDTWVEDWAGAGLHDLIEDAMEPFGAKGDRAARLVVKGGNIL